MKEQQSEKWQDLDIEMTGYMVPKLLYFSRLCWLGKMASSDWLLILELSEF